MLFISILFITWLYNDLADVLMKKVIHLNEQCGIFADIWNGINMSLLLGIRLGTVKQIKVALKPDLEQNYSSHDDMEEAWTQFYSDCKDVHF